MKKEQVVTWLLFIGMSIFTVSIAKATLFETNGTAYINGVEYTDVKAVYDDCLNITYLDFMSDKLPWKTAGTYVENILWVADTGEKFNDWRLPVTRGTEINSWNAVDSELGHLFYVELGNKSLLEVQDCPDPDSVDCVPGLVNTGPFTLLTEASSYWYGDDESATYSTYAPNFNFAVGYQGELNKWISFYTLPVRDGDVVAVEDETGELNVECSYYTDQYFCELEGCLWNEKKCKKYPNKIF